jgi:hypothetical protein
MSLILLSNIAFGQTWIGDGDGHSWGDVDNWTPPELTAPDENDDVTIGNPITFGNNLVISGSEKCKSITFIQDGFINFASNSDVLEVYGDFTNNSNSAAIIGSNNGTIVIKGNSSSVVDGSTVGISLYNLDINKSLTTNHVEIDGSPLGIWNKLYVNRGILDSYDNLTLMADITNCTTAFVKPNINGLGEIKGLVTVQQRVNSGTTRFYHYIGSPVGDEDYNDYYTIGNQFSNNTNFMDVFNYNYNLNGPALPDWFIYDESLCAGSGVDTDYVQTYFLNNLYGTILTGAQANWVLTSFGWQCDSNLLTTHIPVGKGLLSLGKFDITEDIIDWNGYLNDGEIHVGLTKTACDFGDGLNLVANPYPSPIDWSTVYGQNDTEVEPFAYIWTPDANATFPLAGLNYLAGYFTVLDANSNTTAIANPVWSAESGIGASDKIIGIGQAFTVRALDNYAGLSFENSARVESNVENILRQSKPIEALQLTIQNTKGRDYTNIYLSATASNEFNEKEDATKMFNSSVNISTLINGEAMMINRLNNQNDEIEIPLSVILPANEQSTIAIGSTAFESDAFVAIFVDKKQKTQQMITKDFKYNFTSQVEIEHDRFIIKFVKGNNAVNSGIVNGGNMYIYNHQLNIFTPNMDQAQVQLSDASGRLLLQEQVKFNDGKTHINLNELSTGIYMVSVQNNTESFTQKIMINK